LNLSAFDVFNHLNIINNINFQHIHNHKLNINFLKYQLDRYKTGLRRPALCPNGVAGLHDPGMAIDAGIMSLLEDLGNPARVIVVTMAQYEKLGLAQVNAKNPGVVFQRGPLPGVEKDVLAFGFDPQRQAMLRDEIAAGLIVNRYGNLHALGSH
jgi:hypothetical protein